MLWPEQFDLTFNAVVRSKYMYSIPLVTIPDELRQADTKWSDTAQRALLRSKAHIHATSRKKLELLLQWEEIDGIIEREERG